MSYARIGEDSDVYVWADNKHIWVIVNQEQTQKVPHMPVGLDKVRHPRAGFTTSFEDRNEAYNFLAGLILEGINVPGYLFVRLYDEMEELGHKVGIKRMAKYTTTRVMSPF